MGLTFIDPFQVTDEPSKVGRFVDPPFAVRSFSHRMSELQSIHLAVANLPVKGVPVFQEPTDVRIGFCIPERNEVFVVHISPQ